MNDSNVGSLYEGKLTMDKTFGHAAYGCAVCCTKSPIWIEPYPISIGVGGTTQCQLYATDSCTGGTVVTNGGAATWSSTVPSVATINPDALLTGVAPGSSTINTSLTTRVYGPGGKVDRCVPLIVTASAPANVLSAIVTDRSSGTVSATDGASNLYKGTVGTLNLGMLAGTLNTNNACVGGNELVGAVLPTTFPGSVTVKRKITSLACYQGSTAISCGASVGDDTGDLITTNPQNVTPGGPANGHVYNLDTPGVFTPPTTTAIRVRFNFTAYAVGPDGSTHISPDLNFYVRLSCKNNSSGVAQFSTDASSSDNQIGSGTTKTTWNLQ